MSNEHVMTEEEIREARAAVTAGLCNKTNIEQLSASGKVAYERGIVSRRRREQEAAARAAAEQAANSATATDDGNKQSSTTGQ